MGEVRDVHKVLVGKPEVNNNIIFINCNWVVTRWQWLYYMYTNMERKEKVTREFKSGGLHERHVVATWKLGNHLRIRL